MPSRRQFALWTTATLLVGGRTARAEPPAQQVQAKAPPTPPVTRVVPGKIERVEDEVRVELVVTRGGEALAAAAHVSKAAYELADGMHPIEWSYMNGEHPFARRIIEPNFVDLPTGREVMAGTAHLMLSADVLAHNPILHVEITLSPMGGDPIVVAMPRFRADGSLVPSS